MSDVFLSYNREDQAIAQRFAQGFEREGLSVWWMPTLRSGDTYDSATEKALRQAASVAVLWSRRSVESQWVRAEATIASRSGKLVPAMIEPCDRPVAFELTQTADLTHWKGDANDPAWRGYVADVCTVVARSKQPSTEHRQPEGDPGAAPLQAVAPTPSQTAPSAHGGLRRFGAIPLTLIVLAVPLAIALFLIFRRGSVETAAEQPPAAATNPKPPATAKSTAPAASIAVVPFANLTGEAAKEYFSDGMAEELINALAKVPGLKVASRTSSFAYKGKNTDVRQIARDLNVATVLEGSVRSAGARVRVTAQLINAESGYHVWSKTFDKEFKDLFKLEDELASEIVTAFKTSQNADLPAFVSEGPPTRDLEAYGLYLRAVTAVGGASERRLAEAFDLVSQAITRDPNFGRAYLARGTIASLRSAPLAEVESDARKALELVPADGPDAADAHGLLATLEARRGNWIAAEELFAAVGESMSPDFHQSHAIGTLWSTGQLRRARAELAEAQQLAPAALPFAINLGRAYSSLGLDAQAIQFTNLAFAMGADPNNRRTQQAFVDAATRAGRFGEAADRVISTLPESTDAQTRETVRLVYTAMGDPSQRKAAIAALKGLLAKSPDRDWPMLVNAMTWYTKLGALDDAYDAAHRLQVLLKPQGVVNSWAWLWNPELRAFRRDARFQPLVTSLGFIKYWERYGPPDDCDLEDGKLACH